MKEENNKNKLYLILFILMIITAIILSIKNGKTDKIKTENNPVITEEKEEQKPIEMCYYRGDKVKSGLYDVAWIKLNILNEKVTGEFHNIPAESDSKVGSFEGTVGPLIQEIMGRRASVWWNSYAEGMNVKEELAIEFGDGSATVGFGEMVDRGDGIYIYKNKDNLFYIKSMSQVDCETLDEKLLIEKYVRDNIKTIATNKPVLGGSWYTSSVSVNGISHEGEIAYEDGHIQSKAHFIYSYDKNSQSVVITKFEIIK
jgi:hypothetical protein